MAKTRLRTLVSENLGELMRLRRFYARYLRSFVERMANLTRRSVFPRRIDILAQSGSDESTMRIQMAMRDAGFSSNVIPPGSHTGRFSRTPIIVYSPETGTLPKNYYILQSRDLSNEKSLDQGYVGVLNGAVAVLDYSTANIERLLAVGISYKKLFYLPREGNGFYLNRFLLALNHISYSEFYKKAAPSMSVNLNQRTCLSLPETIGRRRVFDDRFGSFAFFDGLRHTYPWVGCGMSYKFLCQLAEHRDLEYLIVVEDDALLPQGFEEKLETVLSYLSLTKEPWHVFSGFMADLGKNVELSRVVPYRGIDFVHINRLTSTVFNIYRRSVFGRLSKWDEQNYHFYTNTIDRYLGSWNKLKVVTAVPFLVGHREDVVSSVWGFDNARYGPMVSDTIQRLSSLVRAYRLREE